MALLDEQAAQLAHGGVVLHKLPEAHDRVLVAFTCDREAPRVQPQRVHPAFGCRTCECFGGSW